MPILSNYAQRAKAEYFLSRIQPGHDVLEIGPGNGWVKDRLPACNSYTTVSLEPPADYVCDIREFVPPTRFDVIIAFEVMEHVDCWWACRCFLRRGGMLFVTTPVPSKDWILKILEALHLNQKRTSPHDHLVWLKGTWPG